MGWLKLAVIYGIRETCLPKASRNPTLREEVENIFGLVEWKLSWDGACGLLMLTHNVESMAEYRVGTAPWVRP
jgi:hypothetical protein